MSWWYEDGLTILDYSKGKGWHYRHVKEEKMEFDRSRVYTSVNADELKAGDKVIVADSLGFLRQEVERGKYIEPLRKVLDESHLQRFKTPSGADWGLAYLVERKENCTNCKEGRWDAEHKKILCDPVNCGNGNVIFRNQEIEVCEYYKPKNKKEIDMDWNYVNEGKLPTKQEMGTSDRVVVAVRGYNTVDVGYYDYELEAWFVDGNRYPVPVYAWHYDKPPKEEA